MLLGSGVGRQETPRQETPRQEIILFILPTSPHPTPHLPPPMSGGLGGVTPHTHEKLFQQTLSRQNISLV
ncbi:MAG: hypothetical protein ACK48H_11890 [Microcystis sp.]|uniref:hypothetical protein n=1 Tax=Microcystis sp. TaxID=1127 RepID=UPI0039188691